MDDWIKEVSKLFDKYFDQAIIRLFRKQAKLKKWRRNHDK